MFKKNDSQCSEPKTIASKSRSCGETRKRHHLGLRWLRRKMRRLASFASKKRSGVSSSYQSIPHDDRQEYLPIISDRSNAASQELDITDAPPPKPAKKSTQKRIRKVLLKSCHYMGVGVSQMAPGIGGAIGGHVITPHQYMMETYSSRYPGP